MDSCFHNMIVSGQAASWCLQSADSVQSWQAHACRQRRPSVVRDGIDSTSIMSPQRIIICISMKWTVFRTLLPVIWTLLHAHLKTFFFSDCDSQTFT